MNMWSMNIWSMNIWSTGKASLGFMVTIRSDEESGRVNVLQWILKLEILGVSVLVRLQDCVTSAFSSEFSGASITNFLSLK